MKGFPVSIKIFLFVLVAVFASSCAGPQAVIRMSPVSSDVRWNYGQAFAADSLNGIIVESAFDKATKEYNIFDVKVVNNSNLNYLVDPVNFQIIDVKSSPKHPTVFNAIDPEQMLLSFDKQLSEAEHEKRKAAVGSGVAVGVLAAATVALAVMDVHHSNGHHVRVPAPIVAAPLAVDLIDNSVPYDYVTAIDNDRQMWEMSTVRKTTLATGYLVEGKLFFPRFVKPGVYVLRLLVDDGFIDIPFSQLTVFP